jgi:hypothetical protein
MKVNYFLFMDKVWQRMSHSKISATDRAVLMAIIQMWNKNFYEDFVLDKDQLLAMSGIKSKRQLLRSINTLEDEVFIHFFRAKSRHVSSKISVVKVGGFTEAPDDTVSGFTEAPDDTVSGFTEAPDDTVSQKYFIHKDLDNKTNINTVKRETEKVEIVKKKRKASKVKNVGFLDSDIGTPEAFKNYLENSEYSEADPVFYFSAMKDWIDRKTGNPPKRKNWKLTFNTFARNDIQKYGNVKQISNGKVASHSGNHYKSKDVQEQYADIDEKFAKFSALRNS